MNLEFTKNGDLYVAEFTAEADFNIHIEKDAGFVTLYQTSVAGGKYEVVRSLNRNYLDPVIDAAHKVLVAPLYIRLVSTTMPSVAVVTFRDNGNGGTPSPQWTGHADAEGLRAIGWTDEDIAYYQEHGVNWNEEDDQYHLVSEDNKALFGVVNATNIQEYRERIVYLPKIDTSNVVDMTGMFAGCNSLTAIPLLDTSNVEYMNGMFEDCYR